MQLRIDSNATRSPPDASHPSAPSAPLPLVHYVLLVTLVDVGHVWGTLFRTYLDSEATAKRWKLFYYSPPIIFAVEVAVYTYSPTLFWSIIAYFAIYHFVSQNYGLLALYKARHGERNRLDYKLDYYALFVGALGPVLLWSALFGFISDRNACAVHRHASPTRRFNWFNAGEAFVMRLPTFMRYPIFALYMAVGVAWIGRQCYKIFVTKEEGMLCCMCPELNLVSYTSLASFDLT